ncbi:MAG: MEDS domain-containing protein, partial [Spirochaetota bacterium]
MNKYVFKNLTETLKTLEPVRHLCCLYSTEKEHRLVLSPFIAEGIKNGQKVLYIIDSHRAEVIRSYLKDYDLDTDSLAERGQLEILTSRETYVKEGSFDPDRMIELLKKKTANALEKGYSALRVTGEMSWALANVSGSEKLIEYESKLNRFPPQTRCIAVCQYHMRRFSSDILLDVLRT